MRVTVISSNDKRKTAMITVVHGENDRKRSETRHCKQSTNGMIGRMLDEHCNPLQKMQGISELWARQVDALNHELGNKAQKKTPYNAGLYFKWVEGDNSAAYQKHLNAERVRASQTSEALWAEGQRLEALAEIRRAEKSAKHEKKQQKMEALAI